MEVKDTAENEWPAASNRQKEQQQERALRWAEIIESQCESGQSIRAFCAERDIALSSFRYWRKRLGMLPARPECKPKSTFLAVPIATSVGEALELNLGEMRLRFGEAAASQIVAAIVGRIAKQS